MINAIMKLRLVHIAVIVCLVGMILVTIPLTAILLTRHDVTVGDAMTGLAVIYGGGVIVACACLFFACVAEHG